MNHPEHFAALRAAVTRSASEFHARCIAEHPDEHFYGLVLYTDSDAQIISFAASSEEAVQQEYEKRKQKDASAYPPELWDTAGWPYRDMGKNSADKVLGAILETRDADSEEEGNPILRGVLQACFEGLQDFVRSEAPAMNGQRGRLVVYVAMGDPDEEIGPQLQEWARQLNPDAKDLWFHRTTRDEQ